MGKARGGQTNPDGNGFLTRYAEDAQRAVDLGLTSFRVSVEWLRNRLEFIGSQYYGPAKVKRLELLDAFPPLYGLPLSDVLKYTNSQDQLLPSNGMGREIGRPAEPTVGRRRRCGWVLCRWSRADEGARRAG